MSQISLAGRALLLAVVLAGTAAAQPARSPTASSNDRAVSEALAGFDVASNGAAWDAVPSAFDALYPAARYDQTRLTRVQARAIAFTAVTLAAGASSRGPDYPAQPPGQPAQSPRERVLELTYRFLALIPTGNTPLPVGPDRSGAVAQGAEAAGAAAAAGCPALGRSLTTITSRLQSGGYGYTSEVQAAQRAAESCR